MDRTFYLDLARAGLRMPIGTDLVLHESPDPEGIMHDGPRLGRVIEQAARRWGTPLAMPLMDLRLDKADLLDVLGLPASEADTFHFPAPPGDDELARVRAALEAPFAARNRAHIDSLSYLRDHTNLVPVGMAIGPFSLSTKLLADPITAIALAGLGLTGAEEPAVASVERCLALAEMAVQRSVKAQVRAGARAVLICEPAANTVYLSPKQMAAGSDVFERFVMQPMLRLRDTLETGGADLVFHDCGELSTFMVGQFATRLHPVILSLGSSRRLWEDAAVVPDDVVLYGNLPTKNFYSDAAMPLDRVEHLTLDLLRRMHEVGHPHILGSECDVLHVPESIITIRNKVEKMLTCGRAGGNVSL